MRRSLVSLLLALTLALTGGALAPVAFGVGGAHAQDAVVAPDYTAWEKVATRAETALADRRASNTALEGLRAELVTWRAEFLAAQDINKARIATLKNQIAALGPAPDTAGVEPAELTQRRGELSTQLADLQAPRKTAEEAFSRADGLISEIDSIIRERQAAKLFELKPSPVNPVLWPEAWRTISGSFSAATVEIQTAWGSDTLQKTLRESLPKTLLYLLVAIVLLWRGRGWMVRLTVHVHSAASGASAGVRGFLVSLGQVALPVVGLYAFAEAIYSTGLLGFRGQLIADGIVPIGVAFFSARWLALRLVPRLIKRRGFLQLSPEVAGQVRGYAAGLGLVWGGNRLLAQLADFEGYSEASRVVLEFPLIAIAGYLLFRFGRVLRRSASESADQSDDQTVDWDFRTRATDIVGRALIVVAVAGPLVAAVGYYSAAAAVVFPTILSLGLLALVAVLSGVLRDAYALLSGHDDEKMRDALVPVLLSFVLALASVPVFALIWGARTSDLTEIWAKFREGFQVGGTRISPTDFLTFAVVFALGYMATRLMQSTLKTSVLPKTKIDSGGQTAIVSGLGYVGIFLAALIAITAAGIDLSSLAIVAGALSVGIGFGLQNIVSNFVSGIILLIERPIAEGDWIEVGGYSGTVRDISVRSTRIETFDRSAVIIPNSDLISGAVTNYTRGNLIGRAVIAVGVAYGSDTRRVQDILLEIATAHPMVSLNPKPSVHMVSFGADSLDFEIRAILRDVNFILTVKSDILHEIASRFAKEGIEIPFAQRDIWLRNPESLSAPKPGKPPKPAKGGSE
jgi:potassium-dependent mechanosensitive channel